MDLAQKANRVKRELQAATQRPEATSIRHAVEAFDAFVDGVVEEIGLLRAAQKAGSEATAAERPESSESTAPEGAEKELENTAS